MATTTNYSWSTPDDTALVKDGAAAIRSLGTAIDSTVFANAGAAIPKTLLDAKGDLIVASAADTAARLAVGTNGYFLAANSGATNGIEWVAPPASGGLVLISTTTIGSVVTTVTVSNVFSSTYDNYRIILSGGVASEDISIKLQLGSTTTGYYGFQFEGTSAANTVAGTAQSNVSAFMSPFAGSVNSLNGIVDLQAPNLAKRTALFSTRVRCITPAGIVMHHGFENSNTQHTAFTLDTGGGSSTITGGTIKVYGYAN
jgi:hypothetical protein